MKVAYELMDSTADSCISWSAGHHTVNSAQVLSLLIQQSRWSNARRQAYYMEMAGCPYVGCCQATSCSPAVDMTPSAVALTSMADACAYGGAYRGKVMHADTPCCGADGQA